MASAVELREQFRALPKDQRERNQDFSILVWRGLSWLERAEAMGTDDLEGRFISAWICFNALYGRIDDNGQRPRAWTTKRRSACSPRCSPGYSKMPK